MPILARLRNRSATPGFAFSAARTCAKSAGVARAASASFKPTTRATSFGLKMSRLRFQSTEAKRNGASNAFIFLLLPRARGLEVPLDRAQQARASDAVDHAMIEGEREREPGLGDHAPAARHGLLADFRDYDEDRAARVRVERSVSLALAEAVDARDRSRPEGV